ncbi:hypothetical protein [Thermococcus aciditolerans]|uniref:Uncharacterized protein n=1 Tax=Thermococcus aciditolerans TaxID=2598455 RepID=A0A5C0SJE6_9EURY|nr:hypothetical protein [Thermococcus aciditolerans]QEK14122.1 hypothetical protein FPV09_02195 [Thermococcus aciditolerans]
MLSLEFEVPVELLNTIMDTILESEVSLKWVYYSEERNSVVVRLSVLREELCEYLLRLTVALPTSLEVSVVEAKEGHTYIHEAFLINVEVMSRTYPVVILFEYTSGKFYPSDITIGIKPNAPRELIDAVSHLTIGRVRIGDAKVVKRIVTKNAVFIMLRRDVNNDTVRRYWMTAV